MEQKEDKEEKRDEEKDVTSNELALFKASIQSILTQVSSAISLEKFTDIFKDIPSLGNKPNRLRKTWELFQQQMLEDMLINVDDIIEDLELNTKLATISQMKDKSGAENKEAWRPTLLSTEQYLRSYDMQLKKAKKRKLEEIAEKKEQREQQLKKKVIVERVKANKMSETINRARETLKQEVSKDLKL